MKTVAGLAIALLITFRTAVGVEPVQPTATLPVYTYTVVRSYPHDPGAYTQGLEYVDGVLYEGTGLNGRSSIRRVELATGRVLQRRDLPFRNQSQGSACPLNPREHHQRGIFSNRRESTSRPRLNKASDSCRKIGPIHLRLRLLHFLTRNNQRCYLRYVRWLDKIHSAATVYWPRSSHSFGTENRSEREARSVH